MDLNLIFSGSQYVRHEPYGPSPWQHPHGPDGLDRDGLRGQHEPVHGGQFPGRAQKWLARSADRPGLRRRSPAQHPTRPGHVLRVHHQPGRRAHSRHRRFRRRGRRRRPVASAQRKNHVKFPSRVRSQNWINKLLKLLIKQIKLIH